MMTIHCPARQRWSVGEIGKSIGGAVGSRTKMTQRLIMKAKCDLCKKTVDLKDLTWTDGKTHLLCHDCLEDFKPTIKEKVREALEYLKYRLDN